MIQSACLFVVIAVLTGLFFWYWRIWSYKGLKDFPSPPLFPFIGHTLEFLEFKEIYSIFPILNKLQKKWGGVLLLWSLSMHPYVQLADINIVEYFLCSAKHITKAREYKYLEPWLGKGLLTSTGSKWHKRRKILTPAFHFKILEEFVDIIHKNGNILVDRLSKKVDSVVDIYPYINLYALDVICETAMGTSINAQINEHASVYLRSTRSYLSLVYKKIFSLWKQFPPLYKLFSEGWKEEQKQVEILHNFTTTIIEKRREDLIKKSLDSNPDSKRKLAFLDLLLQTTQDGQPLSNKDIREEVDTFMFEGNDTVSSAISFMLFELAKEENHHVQQRICEEITEIFGNNKSKVPTIADLQKFAYLELVIKEGLRLYPSVPMIERELEEDAIVDSSYTKGKPLFFYKGVSLVINAYAIHRDEEIYPEPEKFIPERFLKENWLDKSPFAYLPFSAGPRNCIGQKFAMLEMKATLLKIFLNFTLEPCIPIHVPKIYSDSVLKSFNGLPVRIVKRI